MKQSEALNLAIEMLERVAPGRNCDARAFYETLHEIKTASLAEQDSNIIGLALVGEEAPTTKTPWPRTAIVCGEEYYEIDRRTIEGRDLILMESSRDGNEAPGIVIDAVSNAVVIGEAFNGFQDYLCDEALA